MSEPKGCPTPGACSALEKEWTYCPECGNEELRHEEGNHKQCANCHQEWFSDNDYSDVVQKNLSTLTKELDELAHEFGAEHRLYLTCKHDLAVAQDQIARLIEERNEWRSIATDNLSALQTATARIAAAQAREEKLRAALVEIRDGKFPKDGDEYADDSMRMFALATLALPSDTSALDAQIKAAQVAVLREAAMKFRGEIGYNPVAADGYSNAFDIAAELDFMADELESSLNAGETT